MKQRSWMQWLNSPSDNLKPVLSHAEGSKTCTELSRSIENRKWVGIFAIMLTFVFGGAEARAQQPAKVPRIGYLSAASPSAIAALTEAFRQGLREHGYVEDKNIVIEYRSAEGKPDRLPALAAELVRLKVDVIVTAGSTSTRSAKEATVSIPIVMAQDSDPIGTGLVASLARPGGNITGLSTLSPETSGKQLELLREIVPRLSRVAVLGTSTRPGNAQALREVELAAGAFGVQLQYLDVRGPNDVEAAFREASKGRAGAILVLTSPIFFSHRTQLADLAVKSRLPAIYFWPEFVEDGGLMTYGASISDLFRRAATYVDKILKGAKPAELPVEQPTKFEFIINLKAAKQIGLTIPPTVLARADKVIK
jgi:putative tryptophan/tyrosine transport system substrate-binding protein